MSRVLVNEIWLAEVLDAASHKHIKGKGGCNLMEAFADQYVETTDELVLLTRIEVTRLSPCILHCV